MTCGVTDPASPDYDSLAGFEARGDVHEIRIPWATLGFTDPSGPEVWDNLYDTREASPTITEGMRGYQP